MNRRETSRIQFDALQIEGALIQPDIITKVAAGQAWGQTDDSYGVLPGLKLRDEIGRYYQVGRTLWQRFEAGRAGANADLAHKQFAKDILSKVLGFQLDEAPSIRIQNPGFELSRAKNRLVPIAIAGAAGLDRAETVAVAGGNAVRRSATTAVQGELNANMLALWGIAFDGARLRILRDNASLTRPALIEFDLDRIFRTDLYADFTLFWLLVHESRFGDGVGPTTECALETWRHQGREQGVAARGRLRDGVEMALYEFGAGFLEHADNRALRQRLTENNSIALAKEEFFRQLLRLVYRLIFVMTAEDRDILFAPNATESAKAIYRDGYALGRLRERSRLKSAWDRHYDAYEGLKSAFSALENGDSRLGLPALGGLFNGNQIKDLASAKITNKRFLTGLFHLGWLREDTGLARINWRDMETEEFGSVYESLLELTPAITGGASGFYFVNGVGDAKSTGTNIVSGNQRKTTSSYYTKDSLVSYLLDSALDPIIERAIAENPNDPDALLRLSVVDPACGSGHFVLGAARRIARRLADLRNPGAASIKDFRRALREVVSHCVYGVDQNALAVELCRVALWIEAVEPGKPLTFLDAKICHGNSLIGVSDLKMLTGGIPDAAYAVLEGDEKPVASFYRALNKAQRDGKKKGQSQFEFSGAPTELIDAALTIEGMPEENVSQVQEKAAALDKLHAGSGWSQLKIACDLFVTAFFMKKSGEVPSGPHGARIPTTDHVWLSLRGVPLDQDLALDIAREAKAVSAFHWPLMFPEAFARGGFDLVLGNPPWDTMSPDLKEFFAPTDPEIRFMSPSDQKERVAELKKIVGVNDAWEEYTRSLYLAARFMKESGRFTLFAEGNLGKGDFNVYRMFVELALRATKTGGRAAQFVPENLYNGANAMAIRKFLFEETELHKLMGFENTRRVWFDIDTRAKFCMYVAAPGGVTKAFPAAFGINSEDKLREMLGGLPFSIPVTLVHEFSPEALAIAEVTHRSDVEVSRKIYDSYAKFGVGWKNAGFRPYSRELDMGNDREAFASDPAGIAVYEGRMVEAFDHRAKAYASGRGRKAVWNDLEFSDPAKAIKPQWRVSPGDIPTKLGDRWLSVRAGFCDVASPTNQRAFVAALIPPRTVCGDKVPTVVLEENDPKSLLLWLGVANSLAMDFLVRKKVALKMSFTLIDSLPLPKISGNSAVENAIAARALRLGACGPEMSSYWTAVAPTLNIDPVKERPLESNEARAIARAEIDVLVARDLFGLTYDEMRYLLDPCDILGSDCGLETFGALKRAEIKEHGSFITKALILEKWLNWSVAVVERRSLAIAPESLPDGAWIGPTDAPAEQLAIAQLAALLKALPGPIPIAKMRLAALCALEPRYLVSHLSEEAAKTWQRLVGPAATPFSGASVHAFTPKINAGWRAATSLLRSMKCIVENSELETWATGSNLEKFITETWPDGRAHFVLDALRNVSTARILAELPTEDQGWVNARAA